MLTTRRHFAALILLAFCQIAVTALPVRAEDAKPFITAKELDLTKFLAPPPANDSAQTKTELAEILTIQVTRTPEMVARAQADAEENVWRFADVLGPKFTKEALPKTEAFFARVAETEGAVSIRRRMCGNGRDPISTATWSSRWCRSPSRAPIPRAMRPSAR
jgi:acid phosphatase (class A)